MGPSTHENQYRPNPQDDESMGAVDETGSSTPTGGYSNGYGNGNGQQQIPRHQTSQSVDYPVSAGPLSPASDTDPTARYPSPNMQYQQQPMQPVSRPSSGLSGSADRHGYPQTYQDQNQRPSQQASKPASSVVIKVGMVGDAQIGKTSLMVKYVEGSWDEDYIQTLGRLPNQELITPSLTQTQVLILWRRPYRSATPKSPFRFGILVVNASLSTCFPWSVTTQ